MSKTTINNDCYVFDRRLRCKLIFSRHNLIKDPPISKLDLLVCRNALIYFNEEAQSKVLFNLYFALNVNGFLFLGSAETLVARKCNFTPDNIKHRIFTKNQQITKNNNQSSQRCYKPKVENLLAEKHIWQAVFQTFPFACIAVNLNERIIIANEQACSLLGLGSIDSDCCLHDIKLDGIVGLRTAIREVYRDRHPVTLKSVEWSTPNGIIYLDIQITSIAPEAEKVLGVNLCFVDVTRFHLLEEELDKTKINLLRAKKELEYTKKVSR